MFHSYYKFGLCTINDSEMIERQPGITNALIVSHTDVVFRFLKSICNEISTSTIT